MDNLNIVRMKKEHIPQIAQIERECFSLPWSENAIGEELSNHTAYFIVAEKDGKVLGYAGMNCIVDVGYIDNIAVSEEYRRKGIGKSLLQALLQHGKDINLCEITLEVRISNKEAIALYSSFGFEIVGKRHNFYQKPAEDGFIMTKSSV